MIIRTSGSGFIRVAVFLILGGGVLQIAGAQDRSPDNETIRKLLERINREIGANADIFVGANRTNLLLTRVSILESQFTPDKGLTRARAIEDPFYSSLALGGIAATELSSSLSASCDHFREALAHASKISSWHGEHPTSLDFLFQLLPAYPNKQARDLLAASRETLDAWGEAEKRDQALLALSQAYVLIAPEQVESLLLEIAPKGYVGASVRYLGRFLAQRSLEHTLNLAGELYRDQMNWQNADEFLTTAFVELANTDFQRAFEGIKQMREVDSRVAAIELAQSLIRARRNEEAEKVIDYLSSPPSEWLQEHVNRLRHELRQNAAELTATSYASPELIDEFLSELDATRLELLADKTCIIFRDPEQAHEFVSKALSLFPSLRERFASDGTPPESSRFSILGLLVICSSLTGEIDSALDISSRILIRATRISYLAEAYEHISPPPSVVSGWPIYFWKPKIVSIKEKANPDTRFRAVPKCAPGAY